MINKTYYVKYQLYTNETIYTTHLVQCDNYGDAYDLIKNVKEYPGLGGEPDTPRSIHPVRNKYFAPIDANIVCYSLWCDNDVTMYMVDYDKSIEHMN